MKNECSPDIMNLCRQSTVKNHIITITVLLTNQYSHCEFFIVAIINESCSNGTQPLTDEKIVCHLSQVLILINKWKNMY